MVRTTQQIASELAYACRSAREAAGWSLEDTAQRLSLSSQFYDRIERGRALPSLATALHLRRVLGISIDSLVPLGPRRDPAATALSA
ncbi:helix-turn-helix domain-containing protein [Haliangium sp.]|uniref:helix-turn-helix domain-containing protein n=1 Tax=Haliangium sp. TaxID=2663208 RepID=UPI003D0AFBE5